MSRFFRAKGRAEATVPERSLMDWAALSLMTQFPKPTGNVMMDEWNSAIVAVQSYLNGRAIATETDEEREYLLRLRADLNTLHLSASAPQEGGTADTPGDPS